MGYLVSLIPPWMYKLFVVVVGVGVVGWFVVGWLIDSVIGRLSGIP